MLVHEDNRTGLNALQVIDIIRELSLSQGFYSRLYETIMNLHPETYNDFKEVMEAQNFKDAVDVVMFFES